MTDKLKVLDLFSGAGMFSEGIERTGAFETVALCEIDKKACDLILKAARPNVLIYSDVTKLTAKQLTSDGIAIDGICLGFPCQDLSNSGKGEGIEGARSGLWSHASRLVGELRPKVVFVENVTALRSKGLLKVLADLASLGYDAVWQDISAGEFGAPIQRERTWLVAYPDGERRAEVVLSYLSRERPQSDSWKTPNHAGPLGRDSDWQGWEVKSGIQLVGDGYPHALPLLRISGNSINPDCAEFVARAYLESGAA